MTETTKDRFEKFVLPEPNSGCWLWDGSTDWKGYGKSWFRGRMWLAPRVSYEFHKGAIPEGQFVCHACDTPSCVNPDHLFLGTPADNAADMRSKSRQVSGEKHYRAKLTTADVLSIRASSESGAVLSKRFGVGEKQISKIRHRQSWAHIGEATP